MSCPMLSGINPKLFYMLLRKEKYGWTNSKSAIFFRERERCTDGLLTDFFPLQGAVV